MLPRLWLLVGSDRPTDRPTMSLIELSWTAKKTPRNCLKNISPFMNLTFVSTFRILTSKLSVYKLCEFCIEHRSHLLLERERTPSVEVGEGRHIGSTWGCKKAARSRRSKATSYLWLNLFGHLISASTNKKNKTEWIEPRLSACGVNWYWGCRTTCD